MQPDTAAALPRVLDVQRFVAAREPEVCAPWSIVMGLQSLLTASKCSRACAVLCVAWLLQLILIVQLPCCANTPISQQDSRLDVEGAEYAVGAGPRARRVSAAGRSPPVGRGGAAEAPAPTRDQPQQLPPPPPPQRPEAAGVHCFPLLSGDTARCPLHMWVIIPRHSSFNRHMSCLRGIKTETACVGIPLQEGGQEADGDAAVRRESRAARRRPGRLRAAAEASCAIDPAEAAVDAPPRRLETHIWHAKRFQMQVRYASVAATKQD